jgi:hypothetical protein
MKVRHNSGSSASSSQTQLPALPPPEPQRRSVGRDSLLTRPRLMLLRERCVSAARTAPERILDSQSRHAAQQRPRDTLSASLCTSPTPWSPHALMWTRHRGRQVFPAYRCRLLGRGAHPRCALRRSSRLSPSVGFENHLCASFTTRTTRHAQTASSARCGRADTPVHWRLPQMQFQVKQRSRKGQEKVKKKALFSNSSRGGLS